MICYRIRNWIQDYKNRLDYCSDVEEQLLKKRKTVNRGNKNVKN